MASAGVEPAIMGIGPVPATRKVLEQGRPAAWPTWTVIEAQRGLRRPGAWPCCSELGLADTRQVNPNGGAIALGHPLGMSGARLVTTALNELEERQGRYALCTMCIGVGQGIAMVIERL